jgi:exopolysaccharide biosynthesis polyprenyl glycosylphosphotransferase
LRRDPARSEQPITEAEPDRKVLARERRYRWLLAAADVLAVAVAIGVCTAVLGADQPTVAVWLALPLVVLASKTFGLYERDELVVHKTTVEEAPKLFHLATFYAFVFWLSEPVVVDGALSGQQVAGLWVSLFAGAFLGRYLARHLAAALSPTERCLVVGDPATYLRLNEKLALERIPVELVAHKQMADVMTRNGEQVDERALAGIVNEHGADRLIIASSRDHSDMTLDLVRAAKATGARVSVVPQVLEVVGTTGVFDELHGMTLVGVRRFGLTKSSELIKRSFDVLGAAIGLLAVSPLLIMAALAIKLDTRGPVFFAQERVGRDGRRFRIVKFRSMIHGAEDRKQALHGANETDGGLFKIADDPRITRVGAWLRKTSLDELPQLFNVIRGEMSLVGPRPLILDEDAKLIGWQRRRLHLTPGMTGHWQIAGSSRVPMAEMVKIDYLYVAGWSLWNDVKILLRTVPYVLARRGM